MDQSKPDGSWPIAMLYPFGTAEDEGDFIVVHRGLDSPGGVYGRFKTFDEARHRALSLNASYRAPSQAGCVANLVASHLAPHQPDET